MLVPGVAAHGALTLQIGPDGMSDLPAPSKTSIKVSILDPGDSNQGLIRTFDTPSFRRASSGGPEDFGVTFVCPDVSNSTQAALGCPLYILDVEDIMGQPRLMVDGREDGWYAFHALHGGIGGHTNVANDAPPSNQSRMDQLHQPHTVFRTIDHWKTPEDNRYHSPWYGADKSEYDRIYGEDNAAALDGEGRMFVGSLYAYRNDAETDFQYVVIAWKHNRINYEPDWTSHYKVLPAAAPGNAIDSLHAVHVPESDRDVLLWRETASSALDAPVAGADSWIRVAVSPAGTTTAWTLQERAASVGPCQLISNPVAIGGLVYVACLPGEGYDVPGVDARFYQIHAIDPVALTSRHVALVPLASGRAVLAHRFGDEMILATGSASGTSNVPTVRFALGNPSEPRWRATFLDAGPQLTNQTADRAKITVVDAAVQALAIAPESRNVHLIYRERHRYDEAGIGRIGLPEIYKSFAVLDPQADRVLKVSDLQVGAAQTRVHFDPQYQGLGDGIFNDQHDDIVVVDTPRGPREFIAFGDYGYVRFAEVDEINPVLAVPLVANPPPPLPAANPGMDPATVGAIAGTLAAAMSLRLLAARRKSKVEAPAP